MIINQAQILVFNKQKVPRQAIPKIIPVTMGQRTSSVNPRLVYQSLAKFIVIFIQQTNYLPQTLILMLLILSKIVLTYIIIMQSLKCFLIISYHNFYLMSYPSLGPGEYNQYNNYYEGGYREEPQPYYNTNPNNAAQKNQQNPHTEQRLHQNEQNHNRQYGRNYGDNNKKYKYEEPEGQKTKCKCLKICCGACGALACCCCLL